MVLAYKSIVRSENKRLAATVLCILTISKDNWNLVLKRATA